jgi:DNA (cytosine-5)-methyltransferase 1
LNVLGLFSGCGGLDLGFKKAGANIIWANDIDKDAAETYKKNIGSHIKAEDIHTIDLSEIPNEIDVVIGGFPCLGFTLAKGKSRTVNDIHNFLYKQYIRVLEKTLPKYFLIENVPGMKSGKEFNEFFNNMIEDFKKVGVNSEITNYKGYRLKHETLLSADYGVPQGRRRVIIIATRNDLNIEPSFPKSTHSKDGKNGLKPYVTLKNAISDLPDEYEENHIIFKNHTGNQHKVKINEYVGNRKLDWDKPSPTITGRGSRSGGAVIHPHPNCHRRLSVRECARIQSFPDDFYFTGSNSANFAHIGNAVPPIMGFHLAKEFIKVIDNKDIQFNPKDWDLPWLK